MQADNIHPYKNRAGMIEIKTFIPASLVLTKPDDQLCRLSCLEAFCVTVMT